MQVLRRASEGVFVPLTVGGGIRGFTDAQGQRHSALDVAAEYFRSGADKVSIGGDAVEAALEYLATGVKTGQTAIEQISWVPTRRLLNLNSSSATFCQVVHSSITQGDRDKLVRQCGSCKRACANFFICAAASYCTLALGGPCKFSAA